MNLYLLRHGEAENVAASDAARPLTEAGRQAVINVAQQFATKAPSIERCFVSPYLRAQQTAELFLEELLLNQQQLSSSKPLLPIETNKKLVPEVHASEIISFLGTLSEENILLVSHNPIMTELLALLNNGHLENIYIVDTSELICLSMDIPGRAQAKLEYTLNRASK